MGRLRRTLGRRLDARRSHLADMDDTFWPLYTQCREYTMTSPERLYALYKAAEYISAVGIRGDVLECGVWRGGSSMMAALAFSRSGASDRRFFLYDTFSGMSEPTVEDGQVAHREWAKRERQEFNTWCYSPVEEVRRNMRATGLPDAAVVLVKGKVEDTLPETAPGEIALLRLDTDWYESTKHTLEHLFPRLTEGGVLIVDDYGYWEGARRAVDEYMTSHGIPSLLHRVDRTGRVAVRQHLDAR